MVSAIWGVFVWGEFRSSTPRVRNLLAAMFACFVIGLGLISIAPLFPR
jgi:glucose uptake protein